MWVLGTDLGFSGKATSFLTVGPSLQPFTFRFLFCFVSLFFIKWRGFFVLLRQGFSLVLELVLELVLVAQAGLKLTEICLPLLPTCWD